MTQSGKHGIFDGIPYNMLINSINTFYSTVWVPKCSSIILCQFEDHRSDASPKMTQSGKHGIFDGMSLNLLKMFTANSKFLETTPNSLSVILVEFKDQRSDASHKMTQYGRPGIFRKTFRRIF